VTENLPDLKEDLSTHPRSPLNSKLINLMNFTCKHTRVKKRFKMKDKEKNLKSARRK
jgi:hypothetical protein